MRDLWERFNHWQGSGCVWLIVALWLLSVFGKSCSGPAYPFDQTFQENSEIQNEIRELEYEPPYDPAMRYGAEAEAGLTESAQDQILLGLEWSATNGADGSCPDGCSTHVAGCDIKGNISVDSGERIYHLPGQEFYSQTVINPTYGEGWFCTEAEAMANGFRRSFR